MKNERNSSIVLTSGLEVSNFIYLRTKILLIVVIVYVCTPMCVEFNIFCKGIFGVIFSLTL